MPGTDAVTFTCSVTICSCVSTTPDRFTLASTSFSGSDKIRPSRRESGRARLWWRCSCNGRHSRSAAAQPAPRLKNGNRGARNRQAILVHNRKGDRRAKRRRLPAHKGDAEEKKQGGDGCLRAQHMPHGGMPEYSFYLPVAHASAFSVRSLTALVPGIIRTLFYFGGPAGIRTPNQGIMSPLL
jgi:hypothetical protein